jgi:uncharacterized protein
MDETTHGFSRKVIRLNWKDFKREKLFHAVVEIQAQPLWRFLFAQKTEHELAKSRKSYERFPLLWLALFRSIRDELDNAVKQICRSPHSRLLPLEHFKRPEGLKGRLTPRQEEQVTEQCINGEMHRRHRIEIRHLSVDTHENRFVKMVMMKCERELSVFSRRARLNNDVPDRERLSEAFFEELNRWQKPLEQRLAEPLFRKIGNYSGMAQESLVLHRKAGYAKVYHLWQELKLYLDLFDRQAAISMKSVAELYEVWCLLEIRRILLGLGFLEYDSRKAQLKTKGLEKDLIDGMGTAFRFVRQDGLKIRLAHEPPFSVTRNSDDMGIYSWTTPQKPDILLEAVFPDGCRIRWIFDAKYRIAADDGTNDLIPDDAINQMHRYRDALIHQSASDDGVMEKSRPVVGAFVLYPGWFDEKAEVNPYAVAVESVGIGGFPLLPGRENLWLHAFLKEKFGDLPAEPSVCHVPDADEHLLHSSIRIAPTGLKLERFADLSLVAVVQDRGKEYLQRFLDGTAPWYHMRVITSDKKHYSRTIMQEVRHCALSVHTKGEKGSTINYIYDVISVRMVKRSELTKEQAGTVDPGNLNEYWLFKLGSSRSLSDPLKIPFGRRFQFRLTGAPDLLVAKNWSELPDRYVSIMEALKEREDIGTKRTSSV